MVASSLFLLSLHPHSLGPVLGPSRAGAGEGKIVFGGFTTNLTVPDYYWSSGNLRKTVLWGDFVDFFCDPLSGHPPAVPQSGGCLLWLATPSQFCVWCSEIQPFIQPLADDIWLSGVDFFVGVSFLAVPLGSAHGKHAPLPCCQSDFSLEIDILLVSFLSF